MAVIYQSDFPSGEMPEWETDGGWAIRGGLLESGAAGRVTAQTPSYLYHAGNALALRVRLVQGRQFGVRLLGRYQRVSLFTMDGLRTVEVRTTGQGRKPALRVLIPDLDRSAEHLWKIVYNGCTVSLAIAGRAIFTFDQAPEMEEARVELVAQDTVAAVREVRVAGRARGALRLNVAVLQTQSRPDLRGNTARLCELITQAGKGWADVVLTHECALSGYDENYIQNLDFNEVEGAIRQVQATARSAGVAVILGTPTRKDEKIYNSAVIFDGQGHEIFRYSKAQVCEEIFSPGNQLALFSIKGVACTAIICHDVQYPELYRIPVMLGARVVFHLCAHGTRGTNMVYLAYHVAVPHLTDAFYAKANYVGFLGGRHAPSQGRSVVISPRGRVLATPQDVDLSSVPIPEEILKATLNTDEAGRGWPVRSRYNPAFLAPHWERILAEARRNIRESSRRWRTDTAIMLPRIPRMPGQSLPQPPERLAES